MLSSTREGLGLAGIEMLAAGLPVIGSKVQGISDYIHNGINGILCDPNSPDDFCNALLLLSDETTREHFSTHTWESVQQFSLSNSKKNMRQIYDEVLSGQIR